MDRQMKRRAVEILQGVSACFEKDRSKLLTCLCDTDDAAKELVRGANMAAIEEAHKYAQAPREGTLKRHG